MSLWWLSTVQGELTPMIVQACTRVVADASSSGRPWLACRVP
jgi:hypothetical protein